MKLYEVVSDQTKTYAWLRPSRGPNDIMGVSLTYINPVKTHYEYVIDLAKKADDNNRVKRLEKEYQRTAQSGQTYFTPSLGWWMKEEDFDAGRAGFDGVTKGKIFNQYPNLRVTSSEEEAIRLAKRDGII